MGFDIRSYEKEYLDRDDISTEDLYQTLNELNTVNTLLGGYNATIRGLKAIIKIKPIRTVLDIGFGGGDSIKQMAQFSLKNKLSMYFYGVDLKSDCLNFAQEAQLLRIAIFRTMGCRCRKAVRTKAADHD